MKKALIMFTLIFMVFYSWMASFAFRAYMTEGLSLTNWNLSPQVKSNVFSIVRYQMDYGKHPTVGKKLLYAWLTPLGFFLPIFLIVAIVPRNRRALYGNARFASLAEIKKAGLLVKNAGDALNAQELQRKGLFAGDAIIVGKMGRDYIGLSGQHFAYLAAPTRSGKGVGVVIPVALSYAHSMVVLDIKQELFDISAAFRAKCSHAVYLFNPFDPDGKTARWNPLSYVSRSSALRTDDASEIAISLIPDTTEGDNFFNESARKLLMGIILFLLDKEQYDEAQGEIFIPTMREVLNVCTQFEGDAIEHFSQLLNAPFISDIALMSINSAVAAGDKTFASVLATLTANLTPWLSDPVANATSGDDFDLRDVRKQKMTIYLGIQPKDLGKASKIINLFYSQLIHQNTAELPDGNPELRYQCLMLMDEGTSPGKIAVLEKAISYMAGYNLRLLFIAQSPAQLEDNKVYGEHGARNILTNIALKVLYKPNDVKDSEEYSKLLGKITVKEHTSASKGGGAKGVSRTQTQNQRDLMMPQELREMSDQKEIIIFNGLNHPIMCFKNQYYKDKTFMARYLPYKGKAKVKALAKVEENNSYQFQDNLDIETF